LNLDKRVMRLDLTTPAGRDRLLALLADAGVLIERSSLGYDLGRKCTFPAFPTVCCQ
jgi:hypothetical protein